MTPFEALVAIAGIVAVFGMGGFITLKFIHMIRDWLVARNTPRNSDAVIRRLEQFEQRQDQLIKRVQNLETIIVDADIGNPELREAQPEPDHTFNRSAANADRPLKNKLRT